MYTGFHIKYRLFLSDLNNFEVPQSTASQLARLTPNLHAPKTLTVLLLAITKKSVRLMNVNVFDTWTPSRLNLHILSVYLP